MKPVVILYNINLSICIFYIRAANLPACHFLFTSSNKSLSSLHRKHPNRPLKRSIKHILWYLLRQLVIIRKMQMRAYHSNHRAVFCKYHIQKLLCHFVRAIEAICSPQKCPVLPYSLRSIAKTIIYLRFQRNMHC